MQGSFRTDGFNSFLPAPFSGQPCRSPALRTAGRICDDKASKNIFQKEE